MNKDLKEIDAKLERHISTYGSKMDSLLEKVDKIENNHLAHIQKSMTILEIDSVKSATNVEWLMKSHWVLITATTGGLIASIIRMFLN